MPCQISIARMIPIFLLLLLPILQLTIDKDWGPTVLRTYHLLDQQKLLSELLGPCHFMPVPSLNYCAYFLLCMQFFPPIASIETIRLNGIYGHEWPQIENNTCLKQATEI